MQQARPSRKGKHSHKSSGGIVMFTVSVCVSCLYLQTQIMGPLLADRPALYMSLLTWFDVLMCLWSYAQTIRLSSRVVALGRQVSEQQEEKFLDYDYSAARSICEVCNYGKAPRVSHCSTCGHCVYKLDHHCIWTQTCIGFRNQKSFYLFCFYMAIGVLQFWYFSIRTVREVDQPVLQVVEPGVLIIWFFTALAAFFVGLMILVLLASHTFMILTNYRTLDGVKTGRCCPVPFCSTQHDPQTLNLFDRGEIQNIKEIFGSEWLLWWVPLGREVENELRAEKMAPHPDKLSLMKSTNLYEVEQKYCKYMQYLSSHMKDLFRGHTIKVADQIFVLPE